MSELEYGEFMEIVRQRLKDFSLEDYRGILLRWASEEVPARRFSFLSKLVPSIEGPVTDSLIEDVSAFVSRVEGGDYCEGWGWYDQIREERDWGDESWAGEMDYYFLQAGRQLVKGDPGIARKVYEMLFDVLKLGEEPGYLPGDPDSSSMLQVDIHEQMALYFRTVYLTAVPEKRPDDLYSAIQKYCPFFGSIRLQTVVEMKEEALPNFATFLTLWVQYLLNLEPRTSDELLREAIMLKGGSAAISEFARQYPAQHPRAYLDWLGCLDLAQEGDLVLKIAREGLAKIPADSPVRAEVAEYIAQVGIINQEGKLALEGYWERYSVTPSTGHLVDLYLVATENDLLNTARKLAEGRIKGPYSKVSKPCPDTAVDLILLFGGHYNQLAEMYRLPDSSGTSPSFISTACMLMFLANTGPSLVVLKQLWKDMRHYCDHGDYEKCGKIIAYIKKTTTLAKEEEACIFDLVVYAIGARVDTFVGGKQRNNFREAAYLLASFAEIMASRKENSRGMELVEKYQRKYWRYSTFRRKLAQALLEAGIRASGH